VQRGNSQACCAGSIGPGSVATDPGASEWLIADIRLNAAEEPRLAT
jgi:hypothetical protein